MMDGGGGGGGGYGETGGGSQNGESEKEKYCREVETLNNLLQGLLAGAAITGTASTGYSIAQMSTGILQTIINAAYRDIDTYYQSGFHAPANYASAFLNWEQASINWDLSGYRNFGPQHVFATWVKSVGLGNGESVLTDPEPDTVCP